jgi:hypothetical protein
VESTLHRVPFEPGPVLTWPANNREATTGGSLELHWYTDTSGASQQTSTLDIPPTPSGDAGCTPVALTVTVPPGIGYVTPYLRLAPPDAWELLSHALLLDDVRLTGQAG